MSTKTRSGRKRRVRKKVVVVGQMNVTNAETAQSIETVDEEETLIRMVGNLVANRKIVAGADDAAYAVLEVRPSNTQIGSYGAPSGVPTWEGKDAKAILWHGALNFYTTGENVNIPINIKSQRMLDPADQIYFVTRGEAANMASATLALTMFFKKA